MINAYDLKGTSSSDRQPLRCFNTTFHEWRRGKDSWVSVCTRTHERSLEQSLSGSSRPAQVRPSPGCLGLSDPAFLLSMLFPSSQIHPPQAFCQWKSLLVENTVPPRPLSEPALLFLRPVSPGLAHCLPRLLCPPDPFLADLVLVTQNPCTLLKTSLCWRLLPQTPHLDVQAQIEYRRGNGKGSSRI